MAKTIDTFNHYMNDSFDDSDFISVGSCFSFMFGNPDMNGSKSIVTDSYIVNQDIVRGTKGHAKMTLRGGDAGGAISVDSAVSETRREQWKNYGMSFPLMTEAFSVGADQINRRLANMNQFHENQQSGAREAVMTQLARDGKRDIIRRMLETQNILAAQAIYEGKQDAILGTSNSSLQYDFDRSTELFDTVTTSWGTDNATEWADLGEMYTKVQRIGRCTPRVALFDKASFRNLVASDDFSTKASNRRFNLIGIGATDSVGQNPVSMMPSYLSRFKANGWNYLGWIFLDNGEQLHCMVCDEYYEEDDNTQVEVVRANKVVIMDPLGRKDRLYGPSDFMPFDDGMTRLYAQKLGITPEVSAANVNVAENNLVIPEAYDFRMIEATVKTVRFECHCAPIFKTTQTDAIGVLTTVTA